MMTFYQKNVGMTMSKRLRNGWKTVLIVNN